MPKVSRLIEKLKLMPPDKEIDSLEMDAILYAMEEEEKLAAGIQRNLNAVFDTMKKYLDDGNIEGSS